MSEQKENPSFKITYFGVAARAAALRVTATFAGLSYVDQFEGYDVHQKKKADGTRRWAGMPEVTVFDKDGKELVTGGQSMACLRYIAKVGGLWPSNPVEEFLVDEILESINEIELSMVFSLFRVKDPEESKKLKTQYLEDAAKLPYWTKKFEQRLTENEARGNDKGFFVGNSLTVADVKLVVVFASMNQTYAPLSTDKLLAKTPKLKKLIDTVLAMEPYKLYNTRWEASQKAKEEKVDRFVYEGKFAPGSL